MISIALNSAYKQFAWLKTFEFYLQQAQISGEARTWFSLSILWFCGHPDHPIYPAGFCLGELFIIISLK